MDGLDAVSSRIKEKSAAAQMMEDMKDETAQILSVKKEKKKVQPPKLYDLTTLQREANRLLGFTAQQTLDQPHTYSRTKALLPEFAKALTLADHVVLADIYAARETDNLGISSQDLQKQIQELGTPCEYFPTFDEIESFLLKSCAHGDLLITMGAGDVVNIGEHLLGK